LCHLAVDEKFRNVLDFEFFEGGRAPETGHEVFGDIGVSIQANVLSMTIKMIIFTSASCSHAISTTYISTHETAAAAFLACKARAPVTTASIARAACLIPSFVQSPASLIFRTVHLTNLAVPEFHYPSHGAIPVLDALQVAFILEPSTKIFLQQGFTVIVLGRRTCQQFLWFVQIRSATTVLEWENPMGGFGSILQEAEGLQTRKLACLANGLFHKIRCACEI
jgi:hypothetical protein